MIGEIKIKIIIRDGIVEGALCDDTRIPIDMEVVDINRHYPDYQQLCDYADALMHDRKYAEILLRLADFTTDAEQN